MAIFGRFGRSKEPKHKESTSTPSAPVLPRSNPAANLIQPISFSPSPFATAEPALESTMDGNPFVIVESEGEPSRGTTDAAGDGLRKIEEERRLGRAVLSVEDATELVELCSVQIRERGEPIHALALHHHDTHNTIPTGLTTLGLFRPYRTQESPDVIRETCVLFLMHTESKSAGSAGSDGIAGRDAGGRELWKVSNLDLFKESLRSVRVEDVVCVLKWVRGLLVECVTCTDPDSQGLRHISYRKTGFASSSSPSSPLYWYTKYVNDPASHATPSTSFQTFLLPSLPASSRKLLLEILPLMQLVLAQTDLNAMTLRRLSRTFGIYLFGLAGKDSRYKSWEDFYKIWNEAGEALEGCLQWHLRGQVKLPLRLREIRDSKERGRKVKVVLVSIESQGDWKKSSGSQSTSKLSGRPLRRTPVEALRVAFEATESTPGTTDEEREALAVWTAIKDSTRRKLDDPTSVLDDESRRIYKLLGFTTNVKTPSEPLAPLSSPALSSVRASPVVPSPAMSSPTLTIKNVERTPTWTEFASGGFTTDEPFEGKEFGFVKPTERPKSKSVGSKSARSNSTKSLKKMDYSPRSSPRSTVVSPLPPAAPPLVPQPFSTILSIRIVEVDEEFPDFYSDSLGDGLCNSWPSFLISELSSSIVATLPSKINYILLSDNLIPFRNPSSSTTPLSPITSAKTTSSAKSFVSTSESTKRRFFSSARMSGIFTSSLANKAKSAAALKPPPLPPQTSATPPRPVRPVGELIKLESTPKREYITEFEGPPSSPSTKAPALMAVAAVAGAGAATAGLVKSSSNAISLDSPSSIYEQIFRENDAEVALQQPTINEPVQEESPKDLVVEDDLAWPPKEDLERAAEKETQGFEEEEEETVVFAGIDEGKQDVEQESIPSPDPTDAPPSPVLATILDADEVEEETVEDQTIAEPISNPLESLPPSIDTSATIPDISPLDHSSPSEPLDISPTPTEPISAEIEPLAEVEAPELPVVESPLAQASTPVLFTPIISPSTTGSTVEEEESPIVGTIVPSSIPASPLLAQDVEQLAATPESSAAAVEREIIAVDVEEGVEEIPAVEAAPDAVEPAVEQEVRENGLAKKVSVETLRGTEIVEGKLHYLDSFSITDSTAQIPTQWSPRLSRLSIRKRRCRMEWQPRKHPSSVSPKFHLKSRKN